MCQTKVAQIYKKTGNLWAVQHPPGNIKMDSTVRYMGVDLDDALTLSQAIDLSWISRPAAENVGRRGAAVRTNFVAAKRLRPKQKFDGQVSLACLGFPGAEVAHA